MWAYRILLDREPESEAVVSDKVDRWKTTQDLRDDFMISPEFRLKNPKFFSDEMQRSIFSKEVDRQLRESASGVPVPSGDLAFLVREVDNQLRAEDADGLPIPPLDLIFLVAGSPDMLWFLRSGALAAEGIIDMLAKNALSIDSFDSILDFGCGCGRVIRHLRALKKVKLFGTDYNPDLVNWCKENLDFAQFAPNDMSPPLYYDDSAFDFIYALSVFTHLPEVSQLSWMKELARVLRPGGYLLMSTHGEHYLQELTPDQQKQFSQGHLVVRNEEHAGTNMCGTFHPEQYVRTKLSDGFTVIDFVPEAAKGNPHQDVYLLRQDG